MAVAIVSGCQNRSSKGILRIDDMAALIDKLAH